MGSVSILESIRKQATQRVATHPVRIPNVILRWRPIDSRRPCLVRIPAEWEDSPRRTVPGRSRRRDFTLLNIGLPNPALKPFRPNPPLCRIYPMGQVASTSRGASKFDFAENRQSPLRIAPRGPGERGRVSAPSFCDRRVLRSAELSAARPCPSQASSRRWDHPLGQGPAFHRLGGFDVFCEPHASD
jgi:hypothetical protein